jgi:hypothetical protein
MTIIPPTKNEDKVRAGMRLNTTPSDYMLLRRYSTEHFNIPEFSHGGVFDSNIIYSWNPYNSLVRGAFEIVRQICTNGAIGISELISSRIPIINRWEEHLAISNTQLQNKVQSIVKDRLKTMGDTRANVSTIQLLHRHAADRLESAPAFQKHRLQQIKFVTDVDEHLINYYNSSVLRDNNLASRSPSHLTEFDAWNLATEMSSHTEDNEKSSVGGLQRITNGLLFPAKDAKERTFDITPLASQFSNPEQAFFGA